MIQAKVLEIGKDALTSDDGLVILFGKKASLRLREVSLIQEINVVKDDYEITAGQKLTIDDQVYTIEYVGNLVKENLKTVEHTVLDFNKIPENPRNNALYLTPNVMPKVIVGSQITIG